MRKIVPCESIERMRMLVPVGQMVIFFWIVRPLAIASDSGVVDGPIITSRTYTTTVDGGTPSQGGTPLAWDPHGYYEVALDAGSLTLSP